MNLALAVQDSLGYGRGDGEEILSVVRDELHRTRSELVKLGNEDLIPVFWL